MYNTSGKIIQEYTMNFTLIMMKMIEILFYVTHIMKKSSKY